MKRILLSMLVALIAMTSCEKSILAVDDSGATGDVVTLTVNAATVAGTRALANDNTEGSETLTYYLEVWLDGVQYLENKQYTANENGEAIVPLQLIKDRTYTLVAWADYDTAGADGYYNPTVLDAVTIDPEALNINTTNRDAFAGVESVTLTAEGQTATMKLTRPFARVNVATTDYAAISTGFEPTHVVLDYKTIYTTLDVRNNTVDAGKTAAFTSDPTSLISPATDGSLSADYLFAPGGEAIVEFTATYYDDVKALDANYVTDYSFFSIPIKTNYQTNISGAILTNTGTLTIDVNQDWDTNSPDDYIADAGSVYSAVVAAVDKGETDITLDIVSTDGGTALLPATTSETVVTLNFIYDQTKELIVTSEDFVGTVYINIPNIEDLTVYTPLGSAVVSEDSNVTNASVYTKPTTFTVGADATVGTIIVDGGNIAVYGTVGDVERGTDNTSDITVKVYGNGSVGNTDDEDNITVSEVISGSGTAEDPYQISKAAHLAKLSGLSFNGHHFKLMNDIDMDGVSFTYINQLAYGTFDGNGCTISNLTTTSALFLKVYTSTIKDLTLENVTSVYAGIARYVYYADNTIDNCHITSVDGVRSVINGAYQNGGIVSTCYSSSTAPTLSITNCTVDADISGDSSVGGILGYTYYSGDILPEITISGCTVSGSISGSASGFGGIAGQFTTTSPGKLNISNCTNNATVTAARVVGGIVGSGAGSYIDKCTNNGKLTATYGYYSATGSGPTCGGISGTIYSSESLYGSITNCVSNGAINATGVNATNGANFVDAIVGHTEAIRSFLAEAGALSGNSGTATITYGL